MASLSKQMDQRVHEELVTVLPASAIENMPALHINGQFAGGGPDASHDLSAAAVGRSEYIMCTKRGSWKDRVVISIVPSAVASPSL